MSVKITLKLTRDKASSVTTPPTWFLIPKYGATVICTSRRSCWSPSMEAEWRLKSRGGCKRTTLPLPMSCGLHGNQKKHGREQSHSCWLKKTNKESLMKHLCSEVLITYTGLLGDFCNTVTMTDKTVFQWTGSSSISKCFKWAHWLPIREEGKGAPIFLIRKEETVGWQKVLHWVNDRTSAWPSCVQHPVLDFSPGFFTHSSPSWPELSPGHQNFYKSPSNSTTLPHVAKLLVPPSTCRSQAREKNYKYSQMHHRFYSFWENKRLIEIHWSLLEKQVKTKSACFFFTSISSLSLYPGLETAARSHCPKKNLPSRPCCASTQRPCSEVGHGGTTLTRNHHKQPHHACHTGRLPRQCDMLWHLCGTWLSVALRDPLSSHGIFVGSPQYSSHGHFLLGMSGRVCSQHQGCDQIPALQERTRKGNISGDYEDAKQYRAKKRRIKIIQIC